MTRADSRKATVPRGASGAKGIQELLDFIYQCRDCDGDREGRNNSNPAFARRGRSVPGAGYGAFLRCRLGATDLDCHQPRQRVGIGGQHRRRRDAGTAYSASPLTRSPIWAASRTTSSPQPGRAFEGRNHGRGRDSDGFGHKPDSLAAVPEPAPIFLLGTILLATFSIARLRFNR